VKFPPHVSVWWGAGSGDLDFKRLGVDVPNSCATVSREDKDDIGGILVHQARYMIFDNCKLYFSPYC